VQRAKFQRGGGGSFGVAWFGLRTHIRLKTIKHVIPAQAGIQASLLHHYRKDFRARKKTAFLYRTIL